MTSSVRTKLAGVTSSLSWLMCGGEGGEVREGSGVRAVALRVHWLTDFRIRILIFFGIRVFIYCMDPDLDVLIFP